MKNINKVFLLPLLAGFAVGCASPTAFQSSEYDDVYYTSKDKTIIQDRVVTAQAENNANVPVAEDAVPNPEYSEKNSGTGNTYADINNSDANYYSDDYASSRLGRYNTPYRGGLSYYDYAYNDFYWYNRNPFMYGRSAFYDPFYSVYDPFYYSPYSFYGYPRIYTGLTVVIGRPMFGGWYGSPYYGGGYYGGFNHRFYNNNYYYANNGWYRNETNNATRVQYGPRRERSSVPTGSNTANNGSRPRNNTGGVNSGGGGVVAPGVGGGGVARPADGRASRSRNASDIVTPNNNVNGVAAPGNNADRTTTVNPGATNADNLPARSSRNARQGQVINNNAERVTETPQLNTTPGVETPARRGRGRQVEPGNYSFPDQPANTQGTVQPSPERNNTENYTPAPNSRQQRRMEQATPQESRPSRQSRETYQPSQRQERTYEAPRQERTYEAPRQQQRTYEAPSSRPTPSYNGGGGSSSGGGRSSGGRPRN